MLHGSNFVGFGIADAVGDATGEGVGVGVATGAGFLTATPLFQISFLFTFIQERKVTTREVGSGSHEMMRIQPDPQR